MFLLKKISKLYFFRLKIKPLNKFFFFSSDRERKRKRGEEIIRRVIANGIVPMPK